MPWGRRRQHEIPSETAKCETREDKQNLSEPHASLCCIGHDRGGRAWLADRFGKNPSGQSAPPTGRIIAWDWA